MIDLSKITLRNRSSDLDCYNQIFEYKEYLPIVNLMLKNGIDVDSKLTIVDAGANVGFATIYFKSIFKNAQIVALEPDHANFNKCRENLQATGVLNTNEESFLLNVALWNKSEKLSITRQRDQREWACVVVPNPNGTIAGLTFTALLSSFMNGKPVVDLIKIDVEGSEQYLFETEVKADEILTRCRFIAIEIHNDIDGLYKLITDHLTRTGFDWQTIGETTIGMNLKLKQL